MEKDKVGVESSGKPEVKFKSSIEPEKFLWQHSESRRCQRPRMIWSNVLIWVCWQPEQSAVLSLCPISHWLWVSLGIRWLFWLEHQQWVLTSWKQEMRHQSYLPGTQLPLSSWCTSPWSKHSRPSMIQSPPTSLITPSLWFFSVSSPAY